MSQLQHIPAYVYVLFVALMAMGVSRCFARRIRVERLGILPALMIVLGVRAFLQIFPNPGLVDLVTASAGFGIGMLMGWHHARGWEVRVEPGTRRMHVPGDVLMLLILLGAFVFEFMLHYALATHARWIASPQTQPIAAAIWAWLAGMSAGRNANLGVRYRRAAAANAYAQSALQSTGPLRGWAFDRGELHDRETNKSG